MYTATMRYYFKVENMVECIEKWEEDVLEVAEEQEGFIRMQFLAKKDGEAMAIGTWDEKKYAEAFMKTGIFKKILEDFAPFMTKEPSPEIWTTVLYSEIDIDE
ncbi:MAG: hypothetical protein B6226_00135 [Candidatus Cloacimonetes bacterium 4572_65]|nr:MAG: hypothetical protein B6226_00135 [Candidatus Cloacimonetes bacterium 4572_65]